MDFFKKHFGGDKGPGGEQGGKPEYDQPAGDVEHALTMIASLSKIDTSRSGEAVSNLQMPDWGMPNAPAVTAAQNNLRAAREQAYNRPNVVPQQIAEHESTVLTEIARLRSKGDESSARTLEARLAKAKSGK